MSDTTWRELLKEMGVTGGIVAPDEAVLDVKFDDGFGLAEGPKFLVWTEDMVYFPITYDGSESVGSAPRNPQKEGQGHLGGE